MNFLRSGKSVLVTGGAGYVGSHVVLALRDAGYRVTVIDDLSSGRRDLVPGDVPLVRADIGDGRALRSILKEHAIGAVVHLAARVGVAESLSEPGEHHRVNDVATAELVGAAVDCGVRNVVFSSTAAVYGMPRAVPVGEDAPLTPFTPYGVSKAAAEGALRDAANGHDIRYVALRLFNVAGADPALRAGPPRRGSPRLVDAACEVATGLRAGITVFGTGFATPDGTCVRDYVHVTDVAEAHVAALHSLERGGPNRVLNCGSGRGASVREVLAAVAVQAGVAIESRDGPPRRGDPPALVADTGRIREVLGWSPRHGGVDASVATTLRWLREPGWRSCDGDAPR